MVNPHRVVVTGGAGFIGSHVCKSLRKGGYEPVVFDNLSTGSRENVRFGPFVHGDIRDRCALDRTFREWSPIAVMHFAACAYTAESVVYPDKYYSTNVVGLLSMLESMRATNINKIVFSSSCATYGAPIDLPIKEEDPQEPINPYGETKYIGERIIRDYARAFGLRYVTLRYFNACGADSEGELSERHDPETHLIPRALMAAAGQIDHLEVFGDDYATPDGTCIRDYVHVEDLSDAHILALEYMERDDKPLEVNLGTGKGVSIREVLTTVEREMNRKVPVRFSPRRTGDPAVLFADITKARERLGFSARRSDLSTIVRSAKKSFGF